MIKRIKIKGKIIEAEICNDILSMGRGLMFRKKRKPLLFIFKKAKKRAIHSYFCKPFIAIWLNDNRIVDMKLINSKRALIKPKEKFNKLLEIPSNDVTFKEFLDDKTFK